MSRGSAGLRPAQGWRTLKPAKPEHPGLPACLLTHFRETVRAGVITTWVISGALGALRLALDWSVNAPAFSALLATISDSVPPAANSIWAATR